MKNLNRINSNLIEPNRLTDKMAELLGIMFGDGCLSRTDGKYFIYISGHKIDDFEYHNINTKKIFKDLFQKEIRVKSRNDENTIFIRFSSKYIFNELHSYGMPIGIKYKNLRIPLKLKGNKLVTHFLRGLFDTDGCVVLSKQHKKIPYYPRLEISSKSKLFLKEILIVLIDKGFYGSISKKRKNFRLEIPGFKNLKLWMKVIGMNNKKHKMKVEKINSKSL
jgi:hypothetical protein